MWNGPYEMICDWANWVWPFGFLFPLLFWTLIIAAIVLIVRAAASSGASPVGRVRSLDVLAERFARGEINRDEFLQKARDIAG